MVLCFVSSHLFGNVFSGFTCGKHDLHHLSMGFCEASAWVDVCKFFLLERLRHRESLPNMQRGSGQEAPPGAFTAAGVERMSHGIHGKPGAPCLRGGAQAWGPAPRGL